MTDDCEKTAESSGKDSVSPGSSDANQDPIAPEKPQQTRSGLLYKLTLTDILKLVALIAAVFGPTATAYFSFSTQVQKLDTAAAKRKEKVDDQLKLLRTGVLHLHSFEPETVPYYAKEQALPERLRVSVELARCEVVNGRLDAIAVVCGAANGLLTGATHSTGYGEPTTAAVPPPAVVLSPPEGKKPPP